MAASAAPRIFVSYARSDRKKFAAELRSRLQDEHDFPLWQDLADLEGGKDWWQQITEAIDHVEFLVLIMTPAALRSEYVRREWRYARQQGRCVIPVIGAPGIDFAALPGWMRRAHFVDPAEPDQWRRLVRTLEAPCKATRAPFMVEDLPQVFVRRPRELESLVASLLDQSGEEPVAITAALKGAGGYGKTTLARAICHEESVQGAFDDGILWVTLGEQPGDIQSRVVDLIEVLTGERPGFQTTEAAITRLGEVIGERRILIVIDDVWQAAHARPFLHAGRNCARLITTRNRDVLPPNAKPLDVDAMTAGEAIRLLRFGLPDGEDAAFASLAQRLGEWPLLLKLVNGALHKRHADGQPLAPALAWVNAGLDRRGLTVFDARNPVERGDAVAKTLGVSLELFSDDERARFSELAIFPEDLDLPLAVVETLWSRTGGLDESDTDALCTRLYDQSLLLSRDLATRRIRLHDVIRGYLQAGQKDRLPALHAELVEAYRACCPDGWHTGPDDGYFYQYMPWHLREAGQAEELQELLFDYGWLRAKLGSVGLAGVIQDFEQLRADEQAPQTSGARRARGVLAVAVLPERRQALAAGTDGTVRLWDLIQDQEQQRFCGHSGFVWAVAALPQRGQALSAAADGTVRLWDLASGGQVHCFKRHSGWVFSVTALAERDQALSAGADGTIRLWDLASGGQVQCFEGHSGWVWAVAALPGSGQALSAGADGTIRLWDLAGGGQVQCFEGHTSWVRVVAALPERGQALSAGADGTVRLWDLGSGRELQCFRGHRGLVWAVATLRGRSQAVSAGDDGTVRLWDLDGGRELHRFEGHSGLVWAVAALRDRGQVLSAGDDQTVRRWELDSGQQFPVHKGSAPFYCCAVAEDATFAIAGDGRGQVHVLDLTL